MNTHLIVYRSSADFTRLTWAFALTLAVIIGSIGTAFYTGHLALVSTQSFSPFVANMSGADGAAASCTKTIYTTANDEIEVIAGHSQGLPASYGGGAFAYKKINADGTGVLLTSEAWGHVSYQGQTTSSNDPNWVTRACSTGANRFTS